MRIQPNLWLYEEGRGRLLYPLSHLLSFIKLMPFCIEFTSLPSTEETHLPTFLPASSELTGMNDCRMVLDESRQCVPVTKHSPIFPMFVNHSLQTADMHMRL